MNYNQITESQKEIIKMIIKYPNLNIIQLAIRLNKNDSAIRKYLKELETKQIITISGFPSKYCVNDLFLKENPIFKLNKNEEDVLEMIIEDFEVDINSLAKQMKFPVFLLQTYITTLNNYHFIKREIRNGKQILSVDREFILNTPVLLSEREKTILFCLTQNPLLDIYQLSTVTKIRIRDLKEAIDFLFRYHFIYPETIKKVEKWCATKNPYFDYIFKDIKRKKEYQFHTRLQLYNKQNSNTDENHDYNHDYELKEYEKETLSYIIENPDLSQKELAVCLKLKNSTLSNRLRNLKKNELIHARKIGNEFHYYVNIDFLNDNPNFQINFKKEQEKKESQKEAISIEQLIEQAKNQPPEIDYDQNYKLSKTDKKTITYITQNPNLSHKELATSLNLKTTTLSNRLKRLSKYHLIHTIKIGRNCYYYVNENFIRSNPDLNCDPQNKEDTVTTLLEQAKKKAQRRDYNHDYELKEYEKETLVHITQNPDLSHKELAISLNLKTTALSNRLKKLVNHQYIEVIKIGRNHYYCINTKFLEDNPNFQIDFKEEQEKKENQKEDISIEQLIEQAKNELSEIDYDQDYKLSKTDKKTLIHITQNPNLSHKELATSLNLKTTTLSNRLKNLIKHQYVEVIKIRKKNYYYINTNFLKDNPQFQTNFKSEENKEQKLFSTTGTSLEKEYRLTKTEQETLSYIIDHPNLSHKELAISLNLKATALSNRLKMLTEHQFVKVIKIRKNAYYQAYDQPLEVENNVNDKVMEEQSLLLIKNILNLSSSEDAIILRNNFELFQYCFHSYELIQLLFLLDIWNIKGINSNQLLTNYWKDNKDDKINILLRYQEICFYLHEQYGNQESNTALSPKVKIFENNNEDEKNQF